MCFKNDFKSPERIDSGKWKRKNRSEGVIYVKTVKVSRALASGIAPHDGKCCPTKALVRKPHCNTKVNWKQPDLKDDVDQSHRFIQRSVRLVKRSTLHSQKSAQQIRQT